MTGEPLTPMSPALQQKAQRVRMPMNEQFLQWEVLLLGILVSGGFILFMDHTSDWILGLALLTGTALAVAKLDLFHPYTWYTPFFFLYAASVPILVWLELKEDIGDLQETVFLEWLALTVFLVVVGPTNRTIALPSRQIPCLKVMAWGLLLLSMAVSAAYLGHIWLNNLASKYEIALSPLGARSSGSRVLGLRTGVYGASRCRLSTQSVPVGAHSVLVGVECLGLPAERGKRSGFQNSLDHGFLGSWTVPSHLPLDAGVHRGGCDYARADPGRSQERAAA